MCSRAVHVVSIYREDSIKLCNNLIRKKVSALKKNKKIKCDERTAMLSPIELSL